MIYNSIEVTHEEHSATLTLFMLEEFSELYAEQKPVVIVCPGGGYADICETEAEGVASQLNASGYHSCILRYSVAPAKFPTSVVQLAKSVAYLRDNAANYNIDPQQIIVMGFSAGGHLAGSLGTLWNKAALLQYLPEDQETYRINAQVLCYPVISFTEFSHEGSIRNLLGTHNQEMLEVLSLEKQVDSETPPTFIWHTMTDTTVMIENSFLFTKSLREQNVPVEAHFYGSGRHGLSLATEMTKRADGTGVELHVASWFSLFDEWYRNQVRRER